MLSKKDILKHLKYLIILFILSVIFESVIFIYNNFINKFYDHRNLINNTSIEISKDELEISDVDEYGYAAISYDKKIENVSNIKLVTKEPNQDIYMRLFYNNEEQFIPKSNKDGTEFKVYLDEMKSIESFKIVYYAAQLNTSNIDKIIINDNLSYMPSTVFSVSNVLNCFAILFLIYITIVLYRFLKKKKIEVANIFLVLAILIGIISCTLNVFLAKYDEHAHFWRAYEISTGTIISGTGNKLPKSIFDVVIDENGIYQIEDIANYNNMKEKLKVSLDENSTCNNRVGATANLSPISYLPQLIGIILGRLLRLKPMLIVLMGRLTNLISYIVVMYTAIKLMPKEKWKDIIAIVGILPMSMYIAASLSPDAVIISTSMLSLSYIMKLKYGKQKVRWKESIILGILFMIPIMCKIVYLPMLMLFFLIPKEVFESKKTRYINFIIVVSITAFSLFIWNKLPAPESEIVIRINTEEQINFILSDLQRDLWVVRNTVIYNTSDYYSTMIGGWNTSCFTISIFFVMILFSVFGENTDYMNDKQYKLTKCNKIIMGIVFISAMALIFGGMYATWTRAQFEIVEGVQGRYFLPILPLLLLILDSNVFKYKIKNRNLNIVYLIILLYIPIFINTIDYFNK